LPEIIALGYSEIVFGAPLGPRIRWSLREIAKLIREEYAEEI